MGAGASGTSATIVRHPLPTARDPAVRQRSEEFRVLCVLRRPVRLSSCPHRPVSGHRPAAGRAVVPPGVVDHAVAVPRRGVAAARVSAVLGRRVGVYRHPSGARSDCSPRWSSGARSGSVSCSPTASLRRHLLSGRWSQCPGLDQLGPAAALVNSSAPVDRRDGRTCGLADQRSGAMSVVASSGVAQLILTRRSGRRGRGFNPATPTERSLTTALPGWRGSCCSLLGSSNLTVLVDHAGRHVNAQAFPTEVVGYRPT